MRRNLCSAYAPQRAVRPRFRVRSLANIALGDESDECVPALGHTSPILCAAFSPTGNLLATGSGDANARLWDLNTETPSHTLSGHKGWVLCVEWEALERKLATGGHDGQVRYETRLLSRSTHQNIGQDMGTKDGKAHRRRTEGTHKMDYIAIMGAYPPVRHASQSRIFFADSMTAMWPLLDWLLRQKTVLSVYGL